MEVPDKIEEILPEDSYTPATIAWKLYQDDKDEPLSAQLLGLGPSGEVDEIAFKFELLLSVFLEMILHMMKIDTLKEYENNIENTEELNLEPDFEDFDIDLYYPIIKSKFKKICYLVNVEIYNKNDDPEYLIHVVKDRYSRVILKNNPDDTHYFESIGSNEQYDFIPCEGYEPKKKLRDVYAIMNIGNKIHKIRFDTIDKIGPQIIKF